MIIVLPLHRKDLLRRESIHDLVEKGIIILHRQVQVDAAPVIPGVERG